MRKLKFSMPTYGARIEETMTPLSRTNEEREEAQVDIEPPIFSITKVVEQQQNLDSDDPIFLDTFEASRERQDQISEDPPALDNTEGQLFEGYRDLEGEQPVLTVSDFEGVDLPVVVTHTEQAPSLRDHHSAEVKEKRSKKRSSKEKRRASKRRKIKAGATPATKEAVRSGGG